MPPGRDADSRRGLVGNILFTVGTLEQSKGRRIAEREVVDSIILNGEFDEEFVRTLLDNITDDRACPLNREQGCGEPLYSLRRTGTVSDYLTGLKEDGTDPADL
jgi:hypothetical protein